MTEEALSAIDRRAEALPHYRISPGGDYACDLVVIPSWNQEDGDHLFGDHDTTEPEGSRGHAEAEFYQFAVDARTAVPALVAEVRRLGTAIDEAINAAWNCDHHRVRGTDAFKEFFEILCHAQGFEPEDYHEIVED